MVEVVSFVYVSYEGYVVRKLGSDQETVNTEQLVRYRGEMQKNLRFWILDIGNTRENLLDYPGSEHP